MEERYGFPIVTAENILGVLKKLGVKKWPLVKPTVPLEKLSMEEKKELKRFLPKAEVVYLKAPTGEIFKGVRTVQKDSVTVFTLLPDNLIPVTAEFKHGAGVICLVPPSGTLDINLEKPEDCAKREFEEETGIELTKVIPLTRDGIAVSTRKSTERYFPLLGIPKIPVSLTSQKLEPNEFLKVILIRLEEWLKLILEGMVFDGNAIGTTFLALLRLSKLKL